MRARGPAVFAITDTSVVRQTCIVKDWLEPTADVWMDERLVVRVSPIAGRGLFFTSDLPAGTTVIRLGGRLVTSAELDALIHRAETDQTAPYVDTITVYDDAHLLLPPNTPLHFGNHSCDPTLWLVGPFEVATRTDVTAAQEATLDYATMSGVEGFRMECRCGVAACRGKVTSADWMRAELQERYRGHWVPALQRRIAGT
jgi:uncharacterized protein